MTDFEKYVDQVTNEICLLGMAYSDEYETDYSQKQEDMYNAKSTMAVMYKQKVTPAKCANMIFSLHVHPIMY